MTEANSIYAKSGIPGIDDILSGKGIPRNRLYLIQGDPGTGKTTFAMQLLLTAADRGEKCLYITLSESKNELDHVAQSHGWSLAKIHLLELSAIEQQLQQVNTIFEPSELELDQTSTVLLNEVKRVQPTFVVFDSLSELRLLAQNPLRYRRQLLAFKQYFHKNNATVFLIDDKTGTDVEDQVLSIAHGVVSLEKVTPEYGVQRRRLEILKMRGAQFRSGFHDFNIETGGIRVFPRLVAAEHHMRYTPESISSTLPNLDALLGGGVDRGTSTLFIGPAGTGKSTLAAQFLAGAAAKGLRSVFFTFEEGLGTFVNRMRTLTPEADRYIDQKVILARQIDPAEITPGEFAHHVKDLVQREGLKVVLIDSINGYLNAMPEQRFLMLHLHELLTFLSQQGVATMLVVAQHGIMGSGMQSPVDTTYLADTVVLLRFFEHAGSVKKAISVIKKRSGQHEEYIRELNVSINGLKVGDPLLEFHGVLSGTPNFRGNVNQILSRS